MIKFSLNKLISKLLIIPLAVTTFVVTGNTENAIVKAVDYTNPPTFTAKPYIYPTTGYEFNPKASSAKFKEIMDRIWDGKNQITPNDFWYVREQIDWQLNSEMEKLICLSALEKFRVTEFAGSKVGYTEPADVYSQVVYDDNNVLAKSYGISTIAKDMLSKDGVFSGSSNNYCLNCGRYDNLKYYNDNNGFNGSIYLNGSYLIGKSIGSINKWSSNSGRYKEVGLCSTCYSGAVSNPAFWDSYNNANPGVKDNFLTYYIDNPSNRLNNFITFIVIVPGFRYDNNHYSSLIEVGALVAYRFTLNKATKSVVGSIIDFTDSYNSDYETRQIALSTADYTKDTSNNMSTYLPPIRLDFPHQPVGVAYNFRQIKNLNLNIKDIAFTVTGNPRGFRYIDSRGHIITSKTALQTYPVSYSGHYFIDYWSNITNRRVAITYAPDNTITTGNYSIHNDIHFNQVSSYLLKCFISPSKSTARPLYDDYFRIKSLADNNGNKIAQGIINSIQTIGGYEALEYYVAKGTNTLQLTNPYIPDLTTDSEALWDILAGLAEKIKELQDAMSKPLPTITTTATVSPTTKTTNNPVITLSTVSSVAPSVVKKVTNPDGSVFTVPVTNTSATVNSTYTATQNGSYKFFIETSDGRTLEKTVVVNNKRFVPTLTVTPDRTSNSPEEVNLYISASCEDGIPIITFPDGSTRKSEEGTWTVKKNTGSLTFKATSSFDSTYSTTVTVNVANITNSENTIELSLEKTTEKDLFSSDTLSNNTTFSIKGSITNPYLSETQLMTNKLVFSKISSPTVSYKELTLPNITLSNKKENKFTASVDLSTLGIFDDGHYVMYLKTTTPTGVVKTSSLTPLKIYSSKPVITVNINNNPTFSTIDSRVVTASGLKSNHKFVSPLPVATFNEFTWDSIPDIFDTILSGLNGTFYYHQYVEDLAGNKSYYTSSPINLHPDYYTELSPNSNTTTFLKVISGVKNYFTITDNTSSTYNVNVKLQGDQLTKIPNVHAKLLNDDLGTVLASIQGQNTYFQTSYTNVTESPLEKINMSTEIKEGSTLYTTLPVDTKLKLTTLTKPVENLFNISTNEVSGTSYLQLTVKPTLNSDLLNLIGNGADSSANLFGIDLLKDLYVDIGTNPNIDNPTAVKPYNSLTSTFNPIPLPSNTTNIAIGWKNPTINYTYKESLTNLLGMISLTNIPTTPVVIDTGYSLKVQVNDKGKTHIYPKPNSSTTHQIQSMLLKQGESSTFDKTGSFESIWNNALASNPSSVADFATNNLISDSGTYDVLVKLLTSTGSTSYDYKTLELINLTTENFLASDNSENTLTSKSYLKDGLTSKLVKHDMNFTSSGEGASYKLSNTDILIYSKASQTSNPVIKIFDKDLVFKTEIPSTSFNYVNAVTEYGGYILLGTNTGLYALATDYTSYNPLSFPTTNFTGVEIYSIASYRDTILLGTSLENKTLFQFKITGTSFTEQGTKTSTDLFSDPTQRVKTIMVSGSNIYLSANLGNTQATYFIILN